MAWPPGMGATVHDLSRRLSLMPPPGAGGGPVVPPAFGRFGPTGLDLVNMSRLGASVGPGSASGLGPDFVTLGGPTLATPRIGVMGETLPTAGGPPIPPPPPVQPPGPNPWAKFQAPIEEWVRRPGGAVITGWGAGAYSDDPYLSAPFRAARMP